MKHLLILLFSVFALSFVAQTYTMPLGAGVSSSVSACSGNFYDCGGAAGDYAASQTSTITFCPSTPGAKMQFIFSSFLLLLLFKIFSEISKSMFASYC